MPETPPGFPKVKAPKLSKRRRTLRAIEAKKASRVALLEELLMRCHGACEIASPVCTGRGVHVHHALRKSQGGRDVPEHTRLTCGPCHLHLHANPAEAFERGWLLRKESV